MSGKPLLNPGKNWSSKASEVLRCVPRDHLSELLFSAHENSIMKGGRIPSLHVFCLRLHCWLADGLSVTIVLFKKSGRHNLQDYSYIMVSHIWKTKEKKKTFCDPPNCHWLPALFTQISICLPTDMLSSPFSGLRQKSQKCPEASCLPLQQLEPASLGFNGMTHP